MLPQAEFYSVIDDVVSAEWHRLSLEWDPSEVFPSSSKSERFSELSKPYQKLLVDGLDGLAIDGGGLLTSPWLMRGVHFSQYIFWRVSSLIWWSRYRSSRRNWRLRPLHLVFWRCFRLLVYICMSKSLRRPKVRITARLFGRFDRHASKPGLSLPVFITNLRERVLMYNYRLKHPKTLV